MLMRTLPIRALPGAPAANGSRPDAGSPIAKALPGAVCATCSVRREALFGVLDDESLERLHWRIDAAGFAPDEVIYQRGAAGASVYTLRSGIVRFERISEAGDRRIVRLAGRGALLGPEALLHRPYADEAIACTPVTVCRIPRGAVEDLVEQRSGLNRELMVRWHAALDDTANWNTDFSAGSSRLRVLRLLRRLADLSGKGEPVWLPTREQIGLMLGLTMETSSRLVSQLRREGVLVLEGPRRARLDIARLDAALRTGDGG
jgi:CRP-like cAMP-binding protein